MLVRGRTVHFNRQNCSASLNYRINSFVVRMNTDSVHLLVYIMSLLKLPTASMLNLREGGATQIAKEKSRLEDILLKKILSLT